MKIGVCTMPQNIGIAAEAGFEFIECELNRLAALSDGEFGALLETSASFPIPVEKCNCLLPADIAVTGANADDRHVADYLDRAFSRAHALGVRLAVFGSGGARRVPNGFPFTDAWRQLAAFLRLAGEAGERHDMDIAIEPLQRKECNILNYVSEATALAAFTDHPRVGVLGDSHHMLAGGEPWDALKCAGAALKHVHISRSLPDLSGRAYPTDGEREDERALFRALIDMSYQGDVSLEAGTKDFCAEAGHAARILRREMEAEMRICRASQAG